MFLIVRSRIPQSTLATLLMVAALWLATVLGCNLKPVPPKPKHLRQICVTPDGSRVGLTGDNLGYLVDAKTGEIKRRLEDVYFNGILCLPNNEVVVLSTIKAVWLTSEKQVPGDFRNSSAPTGALDNDTFVAARQAIFKEDQDDERADQMWMNFGSLNPNRKARDGFPVSNYNDIPHEIFTPNRTRVWALGLLPNGHLLLAAGSDSTAVFGKYCNWGFMTLDLGTKKVESFGPVKKGDMTVCVGARRRSSFTATSDGKIIAGVFGDAPSEERILEIYESGNERSRIPIEGVALDYLVALNKDGSRVAVGLQLSRDKTYYVYLLDTHTGAPLWKKLVPDAPMNLKFLDDDSVAFLMDDNVLSKRDGKTGAVIWEAKLEAEQTETPASTEGH